MNTRKVNIKRGGEGGREGEKEGGGGGREREERERDHIYNLTPTARLF